MPSDEVIFIINNVDNISLSGLRRQTNLKCLIHTCVDAMPILL